MPIRIDNEFTKQQANLCGYKAGSPVFRDVKAVAGKTNILMNTCMKCLWTSLLPKYGQQACSNNSRVEIKINLTKTHSRLGWSWNTFALSDIDLSGWRKSKQEPRSTEGWLYSQRHGLGLNTSLFIGPYWKRSPRQSRFVSLGIKFQRLKWNKNSFIWGKIVQFVTLNLCGKDYAISNLPPILVKSSYRNLICVLEVESVILPVKNYWDGNTTLLCPKLFQVVALLQCALGSH